MGIFKPLFLLIIIPIFGFAVSHWILSDLNKEIVKSGGDYTIQEACKPEVLAAAAELKPLCDQIAPIMWMQTASIISAVVAALLLASFVGFANMAGTDRAKIAKIFPSLVRFTLIVLAGLVIVQGAILTYGAYIAESYAFETVHFVIIGAIGLGALVGGCGLISSAFKLSKKQTHPVLGTKLEADKHPKLFSLIKDISQNLGARNPENVVLGLEPNFYVTSADVQLIGKEDTLEGETLYLSLPLSRILRLEEIKGIIGHELGHFRGEDTVYSLKFSPVYAGLSHAVSAMSSDDGDGAAASVATIPALSVLSYIIDVFHTNVSSVSREREFEADKAASEVVDPKYLASSLLKIGLYAGAWNDLEHKVVDRMQGVGKIARNLSQVFSSIVKFDVNEETIPEVIDSIAEDTISHPTDSHPPTAVRIENLGLKVKEIERDLLIMPETSCLELFHNPVEIEEELTTLQQQYYVALGVKLPEEEDKGISATILAAFGAHMVVADGKIEPEEIDEAEAIGHSLSSEFDSIEFREYCHYPDSLPELVKLLEISSEMPAEGKKLVHDYLQKIASADSEVSVEEKEILDTVSEAFDIL
ncbi:MAG: M48 family metalloprotease [Pseudomonadota bacterium]